MDRNAGCCYRELEVKFDRYYVEFLPENVGDSSMVDFFICSFRFVTLCSCFHALLTISFVCMFSYVSDSLIYSIKSILMMFLSWSCCLIQLVMSSKL